MSVGRIISTLLLLLAVTARAAETPIPPAPAQYVTDTAGFLSAQTRETLNRKLSDYDRASGHQIVVWIGRTTGGVPIEEWAVKAFEKWRIGRKGLDDGVLLVIMADDRRMRFEVGYGLEGDVPDITAGQIINDVMAPRLRSGDRDGAVAAGVETLLQKIGGPGARQPAPRQRPRQLQPHPPSLAQIIFFGILGLIFLFILITHPSLALFLLYALSSGGRGGGRGGGWGGGGGNDGGFSGGGGRSGGGGASGSW